MIPGAPKSAFSSKVAGGYFSSNPEDRSIPVSIRMNNPGAVNGASWERQYPGYLTEIETTPGNRTTIFSAPEYGVAVWWELMRKYRAAGAKTVGEIIQRYGGGQDYSSYIGQVVRWTTLEENEEINLDDDEQLLEFAKAMFRYEAGRVTPLKDAQILAGFRFARARAANKPTPAWESDEKSSEPSQGERPLGKFLAWLLGLLRPKPPLEPAALERAAVWMPWAEKELGFHETGVNRGIEKYVDLSKNGSRATLVGEPWCADFSNAALEVNGIRGTRSAMARSYESSPYFVRLDGPAYGAIVTMWRGSSSSGSGHVCFYVGEDERGIFGLGGNQSDSVSIARHDRSHITGYWWPKSVPLPEVGAVPYGGQEEEGSVA